MLSHENEQTSFSCLLAATDLVKHYNSNYQFELRPKNFL